MGGRMLGNKNPSKRPDVRLKISLGLKRMYSSMTKEERRNHCRSGANTSILQLRAMGKLSRAHENCVASTLKGDFIFQPNEICDRIVVRDGRIYFVEIKQEGRKLTKKQKLFQGIAGEQYEVVYS